MKQLGSFRRGRMITALAMVFTSVVVWGIPEATYMESRQLDDGGNRIVIRSGATERTFELVSGVVPGLHPDEGPGTVRPHHVVDWNGQWWVFGGELACGRHAGVWKWNPDSVAWERVIAEGTAPDPRFDYVVWQDGGKAVWCSLGEQLEAWEFDLASGRWERGLHGGAFEASSTALFVLDDYVVWAAGDQDLVVLRKADGWVAEFPSDAWAGHLMQAASGAVVRTAAGNVLEFGQDEHRLNRYDYGEKVRFADFRSPGEMGAVGPSNERGTESLELPWVLLVLSWVGFGGWVWYQRNAQPAPSPSDPRPKEAVSLPASSVASIAHWSEPLRSLVLSSKRSYTAVELDVLWNIHNIESPETLRAKRSRIIQGVNTEFNLLYGYDLVRRKRDDNDRRKVLYHVAALPPNLAKSLQRDGVHEFHADNGSDGSDRVTEDGE